MNTPSSPVAAKLAASSFVQMAQYIMPSDANTLGTAFGGKVVQWIDLAAAVAARRHARVTCVTVSIDQLSFLGPLRIGQVALLEARVNAVFGSSMEIEVQLDAEDLDTGERTRCCNAFLTFVALGADGNPVKAPMLLTASEDEARRAQEAAARRKARLGARAGSSR
jgi:acyl-CoA hydrolase